MMLVGSGGIWWDLVVGSFDSTRSRKLVKSVVESFDSTNFPKLPRVAVYRRKSVESTKFYCRVVSRLVVAELSKGDVRRKTPRRNTSFGPTDVFVGIICGWTRQKRSLVANGFG